MLFFGNALKMLSLRQSIVDLELEPATWGDEWPKQNAFDPTPDLDLAKSPLFDRLTFAFRSNKLPFILWALSKYPTSCEHDKRCLQLLPKITTLFYHQTPKIEYPAIICITELARRLSKMVAAPLLTLLLDRLSVYPAIEYVKCLTQLIPYFTSETIDGCIVPLINRFLTQNEEYHYAAAELIISQPFSTLHVTPDVFFTCLKSPVIVDRYLSILIQSAMQAFSEDWCTHVFPPQLLQLASDLPQIRSGVLRACLTLSDKINQKFIISCINNALVWAKKSDHIALILVSKADEIVTPKTVDFLPKFKELMLKVCASSDPRTRIILPKIFAENPSTFMVNDSTQIDLFSSLAKDRFPDIRLAFLESFFALFAQTKSQEMRDMLFSLFLPFFDDPYPPIRKRLCTSNLYSTLGPQRLSILIPHFIKFASTVVAWREFAEVLRTFLQCSNDIINNYWRHMAPIVQNAANRSPHSLAMQIQSFFCKVSIIIDNNQVNSLCEMICTSFAMNENSKVRTLFPRIASSFVFPTQQIQVGRILWSSLKRLCTDPVDYVRGAAIPHLIRFRQFFASQNSPELAKEVYDMFNSLKESESVYVKSIAEDHQKAFFVQMWQGPVSFGVGGGGRAVEQSKSLLLTKNDLPAIVKSVLPSASDCTKISQAAGGVAATMTLKPGHKFRPSKVVFNAAAQTTGRKIVYRKTAGSSTLPPISNQDD